MSKTAKVPSRLLRWLFLGALAVFFLSLAKDFVLNAAAGPAATRIVGAPVHIGRISLGILSHTVRLRDVRVRNPPGFPTEDFLIIKEVAVDVDPIALIRGKLRFPLIVFSLEKVMVFKNKEGKLNVDEIKIVKEQLRQKETGKTAPAQFQIDTLKLNIETVIVKDYSVKGPPLLQAYNIDLKDKTFRNISGVNQLVSAVLIEALKPTAIRSAGMMAATTLLGVGFLPALAVGVIVADDDAGADFTHSPKKIFEESVRLVKRLGKVKKLEPASGRIFAKVYDCDIVIDIEKGPKGKTHVRIKARKFMLAKPQIAAGLLYQLREQLL